MRKFLFLISIFLVAGILQAQEPPKGYETQVIHVSKARISPYYTVAYKYRVNNTSVKDPSKIRALFVKPAADTINRKKLRVVNPERNSLSLELSEQIKYTFAKTDTPYIDTLRVYLKLNKQGKITAIDMREIGLLNDSLKMSSWKPSKAHDILAYNLYKLMGAFPERLLAESAGACGPNANISPQTFNWSPGGYAKKTRTRKSTIPADTTAVPVFRQSFACEVIVIVSTSPQNASQRATGIRFVPNDKPGSNPELIYEKPDVGLLDNR
jgi:hypothetical protein